MSDADRFIALQQRGSVMKRPAASFIAIDKANEQRCVADPRMQLFQDLEVFRNKARFKYQVLRRVARDRELRGEDEIGAGGSEPFVGLNDPAKVALQITNRGIKLCKTN